MESQQLAEKIFSGDVRSAGSLMRAIEDGTPGAHDVLRLLYGHRGQAFIIGITGSPGVGKSTLTDGLVAQYREMELKVGVVAVDPTSPFTGGAILGDRVRMQRHATDEGVFMRSLATRGHLGGITPSTWGVVTVMAAMGKDIVIIETVGVGQDEVNIVGIADSNVVVTAPGLGDDIQAIKAGVMEVGDVFVVNKSDREGAHVAAAQLANMLSVELDGPEGECRRDWRPPVVLTCARENKGLSDLVHALNRHREHLRSNGGQAWQARRLKQVRNELRDMLQARMSVFIKSRLAANGVWGDLPEKIASGQGDPYTFSDQVMDILLAPLLANDNNGGLLKKEG